MSEIEVKHLQSDTQTLVVSLKLFAGALGLGAAGFC